MEKRRRVIKADSLKELLSSVTSFGGKVYNNEPLSKHCSFKIGGPADIFIEVKNEEGLKAFLEKSKKINLNFFLLGDGTNILFSDEGFRGAVIKLTTDFEKIETQDNKIICGAAAKTPAVLRAALNNKLSGLECIAGVPGTIGGAVFGNAGSADQWIGNAVESVEVYNFEGKKEVLKKADIKFAYRTSSLDKKIITKIAFLLNKDKENGSLKAAESISFKKETQPLDFPNAGSIFKNPKGFSSGKLIEEAGLKGLKSGDAQISEKHANFIINNGNATAKDVIKLADTAKKSVKDKFNIDLELEIKVIK